MAYEIEKISEGNVDTPLTNFPVGEDTFPRMSDVSVTLLPLVLQYNNYYQNGQLALAQQLLVTNPELNACLHNAEKWNMIRDAIIAMQRFLLNQVDSLYNEVAQNAIGVNDEPTEEQASVVAYSAAKVNSMFKVNRITLPLSEWNDVAPYKQTIKIADMKKEYEPFIGACLDGIETELQKKQILKSWNYVDSINIDDGQITIVCKFKKPISDIPLIIKGV